MIDKDQEAFERHCSEFLNMDVHLPKAQAAYHLAHDAEPVKHKRKNAGQRAMNQYLYARLADIGWQDWRPSKDGKKPQRRQLPRQAKLTDDERRAIAGKSKAPSKYHGKILRDAGLV